MSRNNAKSSKNDQYVDLKNNGKFFPFWILHNFKQHKLPAILRGENEDPCNIDVKIELRKYQTFIGNYLGPGSPYDSILLYHGLGSGKTATAINLINIMYNYDHDYVYVILIKASLHDDPWNKDLKVFLGRDPSEESVGDVTKLYRFKNIHFVHYDSPFAGKDFLNVMKSIDTSKPILFIIDEAHNFIRNVYSNINSSTGKRAQIIYEYIVREKRENKSTKIILISATPGINTPFELSLMFNLLRPGILPLSEVEFTKTFVTESSYPILNPTKRNIFERRILGLVSYYIGATPDLYARQELTYVDLVMSEYQYGVYRVFEKKEEESQQKAMRYGKQSQLYHTYTRQACNFVFPLVTGSISGATRPRPNLFRVSENAADKLDKGKTDEFKNPTDPNEREMLNKYQKAMDYFVTETEKYFRAILTDDIANKHTINDDLNEFSNGFETVYEKKFINFYESDIPKSRLFTDLYECSPKMLAIAFMSYISPGKVMIYTNYVAMEGIDMLKVYFRLIGYNDYTIAKPSMGYCEYHGRIDFSDRVKIKDYFNSNDNVYGTKCKIIFISPSAAEGIQLLNIRQVHILEPYWTEVRIQQVIGRGIRQCSHKQLPQEERVVNVYRYKVFKPETLDPDDTVRFTTDEYIEDQAKAKSNLIESFLSAMKEAAVDCELFKNHNMMSQHYNCFKFPEESIKGKNIGPAYKEDLKDDIKYDSGLYAKNSYIERIKVIKITAVYQLGAVDDTENYSTPDRYWYNPKTGMVYDYDTYYPIGQVLLINDVPNKLDKDTYIISTLINIPTIENVTINP